MFASGEPILADGAMGTMLFAAGLSSGDPPEVWNLAHPDVVRGVHRGYLDAGSRILLTNTFGANRLRLALHRLEDRVEQLNRTAAILLRAEVTAAGVEALVAGDIGPSGEIMAPLGTLEREAAIDVFAEQAGALAAGGADLFWIETMSDLSEMAAAIAGARRASPATPVVATMTFDTRGHTMMGVSPEDAARALSALGVDAIGGNCGNGPDELLPVIERMRAVVPDLPLVAKPNIGIPVFVGARAEYQHAARDDGDRGDLVAGAWRDGDRRVLRQHAGPSRGDGRGAPGQRQDLTKPRSRPVHADRPAGRRWRRGVNRQRGRMFWLRRNRFDGS